MNNILGKNLAEKIGMNLTKELEFVLWDRVGLKLRGRFITKNQNLWYLLENQLKKVVYGALKEKR